LAMLTREAARFSDFELRMAATVRGLERDPSGRVTGVRLAGGELLTADYVIATDGRNSVVRKRLGLELEQLEQPFDVLWSRGPLVGPFARPDGAFVEFLPGGGATSIFPAPAGGHQIGVIMRKSGLRTLREAGQTASLDWLR